MEKASRWSVWFQRMLYILVAGVVMANIRSIFVDFDIDSEYAIAMSYRMLQGDRMFIDMWEPHQMSAFLCTFFMKLYHMIAGTYTGIVLFLHFVGAVIYFAITWAIYKVLKPRVGKTLVLLMCIFFGVVRPKDILFPEFSNMQLWFSVLLFLCVLTYISDQSRKERLILASICLCLQIISYPSCVIVYVPVIVVLYLYTSRKWKNILTFTCSCAVQGCAYILYFWIRIGEDFWKNIIKIVVGDESHSSVKEFDAGYYLAFLGKGLTILGICFVLALLVEWVIGRKRLRERFCYSENRGCRIFLAFLVLFCVADVICIFVASDNFSGAIIYLVLVVAAFFGLKYCNDTEKMVAVAGMSISLTSFLATMMLTNLNFISIVKYMILAVMVSFIPIFRMVENRVAAHGKEIGYSILLLFCAVMVLRKGIIVKTIYISGDNLTCLGGIIRSGPAMGLVTDYMGAYVNNTTMEEWKEYVKPGDNLLIVGGELLSTIGYVYEDVQVSIPSTICTPTYNEMMLEYWEEHPDKYPDVIVVDCWYGELKVDEESWIMQWIEEEFQPSTYEDGSYWRYYIDSDT